MGGKKNKPTGFETCGLIGVPWSATPALKTGKTPFHRYCLIHKHVYSPDG